MKLFIVVRYGDILSFSQPYSDAVGLNCFTFRLFTLRRDWPLDTSLTVPWEGWFAIFIFNCVANEELEVFVIYHHAALKLLYMKIILDLMLRFKLS